MTTSLEIEEKELIEEDDNDDMAHQRQTRNSECCIFIINTIQQIRFKWRNREISLISGVDKVAFGTVSAAEAVEICGVKPMQYLWYMLSGAICDVIQLLIDCFLHFGVGIEDASICWLMSFFISVAFRHTTHRYLVFGDYVGGYSNSLLRMYGGYSVIIVLSTLFNIAITKVIKVPHYVGFIFTLGWTGIVNYFILKKLWSFGGKPSKQPNTTETTCAV